MDPNTGIALLVGAVGLSWVAIGWRLGRVAWRYHG